VSLHHLAEVSEEDFLRCIRCGLCSYTCPTYRVLLTQAQSPRGRVALMRAYSRDGAGAGESLTDKILSCTLCAACVQVCPSGVKVDEFLLRAREDLAGLGLLPASLARLSHVLHHTHNLTGEDNALRLIWMENLPRRPSGADKEEAEIIYFVGCMGSFFPRSFSIPQATVKILDAAGVEYALLGGGEWCCGFPLVANGGRSAVQEVIVHNVERVRAAGARQVVFTCPSCYHMWKHEYPRIAGREMAGLQLTHVSKLLADLIQQGRLALRGVHDLVTYHDPCDLGRKGKCVEPPRQVLRAIPGLTLVEMRDTGENALCCGGGGNLESYDPELVQAASRRRLAQALETGAQTIVSACQQCERTLAEAVRQQGARLRVLDITEIVCKAIE